jgi:hypothetical protein
MVAAPSRAEAFPMEWRSVYRHLVPVTRQHTTIELERQRLEKPNEYPGGARPRLACSHLRAGALYQGIFRCYRCSYSRVYDVVVRGSMSSLYDVMVEDVLLRQVIADRQAQFAVSAGRTARPSRKRTHYALLHSSTPRPVAPVIDPAKVRLASRVTCRMVSPAPRPLHDTRETARSHLESGRFVLRSCTTSA